MACPNSSTFSVMVVLPASGGVVDALKEELTRRISKRYDDVEVIVKATSNDGLSVTRTADKDSAKTFVQETLKDTGSLLTSGLFTN